MLSGYLPKIGEFVKVSLPGEAPWVECLAVNEDGTWIGRIDNYLFAQRSENERIEAQIAMGLGALPLPALHGYRQDDVVVWKMESGMWRPSESPPARA